jgi:hypothetical protein
MSARSLRADVRNPLLQLPAARRLAELPPESQAALRELLDELAADARSRADLAWRKHKAPMAAYWKAVAVYAKHTGRLLRRGADRPLALQACDELIFGDGTADCTQRAIDLAREAITKARGGLVRPPEYRGA